MRNAVLGLRVLVITDVVKISEGLVADRILAAIRQRADFAGDVFEVRLPRNVRILQQGHQVQLAA